MALKKTNADVVGKRAHFMYLEGKKLLILRNPQAENRFVKTVAGATLVIRKRVFQKGVRFSNRSLGEDVVFCRDSVAKGFKIYSTGKYNFVAIRRKLSKGHTWTVTDNRLLSGKGVQFIRKVKNFKQYVSK
ncbi:MULTISPECIES: hypothetical protein [unclassified Paenibacillus]|uniref:hypothetical protein n=1 Tax=unclassified Paenibacillus TaxID=185978 RepID=UPI001C7DA887|nr:MULTISPECIES: hypothetical protein [unclassified Paenibacillus]